MRRWMIHTSHSDEVFQSIEFARGSAEDTSAVQLSLHPLALADVYLSSYLSIYIYSFLESLRHISPEIDDGLITF